MATTTASITFNTSEFTGGGSIRKTTNLNKAGTSTGLDQFTGVSRVVVDAATNDLVIASAGDYADNQAGKIYIKNSTVGSDASTYILVEVGSNVIIGRLYNQDWMFIPYDGTEDIKVSTSAANMSYEFAIFHEG
tara:strand:+ start:1320 stop:1721 length:402 start_codon:yes stop_codon:yes gene_type:complete